MKKQNSTLNIIEKLARRLQLWYMKKPNGMERIEEGALYFHPKDYRLAVLSKYQKRTQKLILNKKIIIKK